MKLTVTKRTRATKSALKAIRREGNIPAVVYGLGHPVEPIVINGSEFLAILRTISPGHLATRAA